MFSFLPEELISEIFGYIIDDPPEHVVLRQVSKTFLPMKKTEQLRLTGEAFCCSISRLQWAIKNGYIWKRMSIVNDHFDVLKWAMQNGCFWSKKICYNSVMEGRLDILKWARENGCPWDSRTCSAATYSGHLEVLKWARENGCPWDSQTVVEAARHGQLKILKWAIENGCPWDSLKIGFVNHITELQSDLLRWIKRKVKLGEVTEGFMQGFEKGQIEVLDWLKEQSL